MEGLIPLIYKAVVQNRSGGKAAYIRLPGDPGLFHSSDTQLLLSDRVVLSSSSPFSITSSSSSVLASSSKPQSPHQQRLLSWSMQLSGTPPSILNGNSLSHIHAREHDIGLKGVYWMVMRATMVLLYCFSSLINGVVWVQKGAQLLSFLGECKM